MERERKDLMDTRGRKTLIDTRRRRRDSVLTTSREGARSPTPEPPAKRRRPNVDLGAMLKPAQIPPDKYYAIQSVLFEQDKIMSERGDEIRDRCIQIHNLKKDLDDANARIDRDQERLKKKANQIAGLEKQLVKAKGVQNGAADELRKRKRYFEEVTDDQEDLINVGRKILTEKTQEASRLTEENKQLRATISDRDGTISSLNNQVLRISMASGDEMATMAIESQAQRTLSMVRGLQKNIAERDIAIEDYKAKNDALNAANSQFKGENAELKNKNADSEKALKAVEKRAAESKAILEDQNKLIDRLMKDNARLLEANEKVK